MFFIDEYTDLKPISFVEEKATLVIDTAKNPYKSRPEGENPLGQMTQESVHIPSHDPFSYSLVSSVCQLGLMISTPNAGKHFIEKFVEYMESVVEQATNRVNDSVRTVEEFFPNRRLNSGSGPFFVPLELHLDLPDEAYYHPEIQEMEVLCTDMIVIDNVSFKIR